MERNLSLDILKLLLAIFVVFLHTSFFLDFSKEISYLLVQGLFRTAVPLFLIITGFYFIHVDTKKKFVNWFKRVALLFLIWNLFYIPLWYTSNIFSFLLTAFNGYFVLWYLSGTAIAGLMLYALRNLKSYSLLGIALILYIAGWMIQQLGNLHILPSQIDKLLNFTPIHRNFIFFCFPFLTLGYLINRDFVREKRTLVVKNWQLLAAIFIVVLDSYINYKFISTKEGLDQLITLFIAVPVIFVYFLNLYIPGKNKNIANLSTGIFLIHPLFMFLLANTFIKQQGETLFSVSVLLCSIFTSFLLVQLNKKLKYIL